jgi:hypothetical protein
MKTSIICTGASLKDFDFSQIKGHKIAVNYAFKYIDYDILVALDDPKRHGFLQRDLHTNQLWADKYNHGTGWKKTAFKGIDRTEGCIGACNGSLFAAINIALHLGFKEIDVYGADMRLTNGYSHFYSEKPCDHRQKKNYERVFRRHESHKLLFMSQLLEDEKITFINEQPPAKFNGVIFERL